MAKDSKYGEIDVPGIPADEPILILRAQDVLAPFVIEEYARLRKSVGTAHEDLEIVVRRFQNWGTRKIPD